MRHVMKYNSRNEKEYPQLLPNDRECCACMQRHIACDTDYIVLYPGEERERGTQKPLVWNAHGYKMMAIGEGWIEGDNL